MTDPDLIGDLARSLMRPASGSDGSGDTQKFKAEGKTDHQAFDLASGVADRSSKTGRQRNLNLRSLK
jgi:hypothetical protein